MAGRNRMSTKQMLRTSAILAMLGLCATRGMAEVPEEVIQASFFPYKHEAPHAEGVTPGMTIDKNNADVAKSLLAPTLFDVIKKGDYAIEVQETTDLVANPKFIEATRQTSDKVSIGPDETLRGFVNGRPFPQQPDVNDPQAGLKLAWNFQYGRVWGDLGCIEPWYWNYR